MEKWRNVDKESYQQCITSKQKQGKTKASLVVRGFEEKNLEIPRDSPTVGKVAMRIFLSVAGLQQ